MSGVEGCARREWAARHVLAAGALLGKSCSAALKLAGHKPALQTQVRCTTKSDRLSGL